MAQGRHNSFGGIEGELDTWRKTSFDRLLQRREALPELSALVTRSSRDNSKAGTLEEIRALLIAAIAAVGGGESPTDLADSAARVSSPRVIREIFGLTSRSKNASTENRQKLAGEAVACGEHTIRKLNTAHVQQLAIWVNSYGRSTAAPLDKPKRSDHRIPAREVGLDWLRSTYQQLTTSPQKLFMLWGVAGMGKTTLAQQFADTVGPEERTGFIRIGRRGLYEEDVRRILLLEGHDVTGWADGQCQALFRVVAQQLKHVRLLVLDEAQTADDVTFLIPKGCNVPVLVTARERVHFGTVLKGPEPPSWQIMPLSRADSVTYLISQIPGITKDDATKLAYIAGGHAETLSQVCRYLSSPEAVAADELISELSLGTSNAVHSLSEIHGTPESLAMVVRHLFQQVPDRGLGWGVLACMAWTSPDGVHWESFVEEMFGQWFGSPPRLHMDAALAQLQRLGLIMRKWDCIGIPRLTLEVLRDLLIESYDEVLCVYEDLVSATPSEQDTTSDYLWSLRQERSDTQSLDMVNAEFLNNSHERKPVLLCLDRFSWALFVSIASRKARLVTLYNLAPTGMRVLSPRTRRWEFIQDSDLESMAAATKAYFSLIYTESMKRRTPEGQKKLNDAMRQIEAGPIISWD
ncbi:MULTISPECIES: ATP-binding protein [Streptomyces]|uniref:ATP-binding protein n=1 Tax=Streptomyces TaxID=1883 RepID=UPI000A9601FC|nr:MULTISPECIES: ATP-binding protein [Streptomyces]QRV55569.1 ATP-binding protein [Streptomyces californicus]